MLSLYELTKEELKEMSFIEVTYELLKGRKDAMAFKDIMNELTTLLDLTEDQVKSKIAQFYTDLNIDGRFLGLGDNRWGLRVWYPIEQQEEDVVTEIKPKKKKAKKAKDEDDLDLEYDDLDDEDIDYDDIDDIDDEFEEEDEIVEDDEIIDDEDLDEDDDLIDEDEEYDLGDEDEDIEEDEELELDEEELD
ncbi:DNA-directed RNA polymerase subunit delta [Bacillus sp. DTU_2020_1000418_1_SI_GHA_SEK_038]|uniref:DNA-directed RNA polymerase subunit delta n=1 Tax=Bacillus sp. DTU_2020_1000418_1_SI_GHA_SEK_038 TaxID=3077585 RepID=UPI0028EE351F|nr:DNA-directed RNA polymerase subunit delta [Bacillus sp. DTU_2020_1000418_1_SI_GHA_SEK_038]WNS75304.1 DNA-directed RNA polymerase subunit delta [Bacillus sp. DTU_2020_1000418_1_SI_GHA_SEK_038]